MKMIEVTIENGVIKLAPNVKLPEQSKLVLLLLEAGDDVSSIELMKLADASGSFDFLNDEPDLYAEADIKPENRNPNYRFRKQ
jgi:predicted DNA-binding antitoxin AbrB/MazE fold protein